MAAKKSAKKPAKAKTKATKATKATTPAEKRGGRSAAKGSGTAPAASGKVKKSGVRASAVNLGHIFSLRPRATTSFPQKALHEAKQALADESYATIAEAARAVADRALEITHDAARPGRGRNRGNPGSGV